MSNTKRYVHKNCLLPIMTEKYLSRDKHEGKNKNSKNHRFTSNMKNSCYNLLRKIDDLKLSESLSE